MLNPNGGILVLVEKGNANGFAAIAGARQMILDRLISSPGSTTYEQTGMGTAEKDRVANKEKGMIVAPCTNHEQCPLHVTANDGRRPSYHCHFSQRYVRPGYLQRILGVTDRNHEDVLMSYLAVQRGVDQRELRGLVQDAAAVDSAFVGYEKPVSQPPPHFEPFLMPRIISSPLKRKGHVTMDLCTPGGKIERWIVPRSFSKQAYHDARKASWGDLWALGGKTRLKRDPLEREKKKCPADVETDFDTVRVPPKDLRGLPKWRKKIAKKKAKKTDRMEEEIETVPEFSYNPNTVGYP